MSKGAVSSILLLLLAIVGISFVAGNAMDAADIDPTEIDIADITGGHSQGKYTNCNDPDDKDAYMQSICTYEYRGRTIGKTDSCRSKSIVSEYYCKKTNDKCRITYITCAEGEICKDGRCIMICEDELCIIKYKQSGFYIQATPVKLKNAAFYSSYRTNLQLGEVTKMSTGVGYAADIKLISDSLIEMVIRDKLIDGNALETLEIKTGEIKTSSFAEIDIAIIITPREDDKFRVDILIGRPGSVGVITAKTSDLTSDVLVSFDKNSDAILFSGYYGDSDKDSCITGKSGSCSVLIRVYKGGVARITASANGYTSSILIEATRNPYLSLFTEYLAVLRDGSLITAKTSDVKSDVLVSFSTDFGSLDPKSCATYRGSCTVKFIYSQEETNNRYVTIVASATGYTSGRLFRELNYLLVNADPSTINIGGESKITVKPAPFNVSGVNVLFSTDLGGLSPTKCTTREGACSVTFASDEEGIATIIAIAEGYASGSTKVTVKNIH